MRKAASTSAIGTLQRNLPGIPGRRPDFVTVPATVLEDYVTLSSEKARDAILRTFPALTETDLLEGQSRFTAWGGFFWSSSTYEHVGFRHRYVLELFVERARKTYDALSAVNAAHPQAFSSASMPCAATTTTTTTTPATTTTNGRIRRGCPFRVVSCGAGPGCDLFGADLFLRVFYPEIREKSFTAVDSQDAWRVACAEGLGYQFACADYKGTGEHGIRDIAGADLVIFSHVLEDFAPENTKTFMKAVVAKMNPQGRVLVLERDDVWIGRPPKPPSMRIDGLTDKALLFWRKDDVTMAHAAEIVPEKVSSKQKFKKLLTSFIPDQK